MGRLAKRGFAFSVEEFHRAARSGDVESVEEFLNAGMAVDVPDAKGTTALGAACLADATEVVRLLLKAGAKVDAPAAEGRLPLLLAASAGSGPTVRLLMENGANPQARDAEGWHPLALATWHHRIDAAHVLAAQAPAIDLDDALLLATLRGDVEMTDFFLRRGASVRARDTEGRTPLMLAAIHGHVAVTKRLLDNGANRFELDEQNQWTASQFAARAETDALARGDTLEASQCRELAVMLSAPPGEIGEPAGIFADPREVLTLYPEDPSPDETTAAAISAGKIRLAQPLKDATLAVPSAGMDGLAAGWKVTEYRERPAPIVLDSVHADSKSARFRPLYGTQQRLEAPVGQSIPGTNWRLVSVRRKMGKTKDSGELVEQSTAIIEILPKGEKRELHVGQLGDLEDPYMVLTPTHGGQLITARRGDKFKLTGDPAVYLVADIGPESILIENTTTRQTRKLSLR